MVSRILKYEDTVPADETDFEIDSKSPGSEKEWEVVEFWCDVDQQHRYSLVYEERKLFDNIIGDELPDEDNGVPFNVEVGPSEDLAVLGTDLNSTDNEGRFYIRVEETTTRE